MDPLVVVFEPAEVERWPEACQLVGWVAEPGLIGLEFEELTVGPPNLFAEHIRIGSDSGWLAAMVSVGCRPAH